MISTHVISLKDPPPPPPQHAPIPTSHTLPPSLISLRLSLSPSHSSRASVCSGSVYRQTPPPPPLLWPLIPACGNYSGLRPTVSSSDWKWSSALQLLLNECRVSCVYNRTKWDRVSARHCRQLRATDLKIKQRIRCCLCISRSLVPSPSYRDILQRRIEDNRYSARLPQLKVWFRVGYRVALQALQ